MDIPCIVSDNRSRAKTPRPEYVTEECKAWVRVADVHSSFLIIYASSLPVGVAPQKPRDYHPMQCRMQRMVRAGRPCFLSNRAEVRRTGSGYEVEYPVIENYFEASV